MPKTGPTVREYQFVSLGPRRKLSQDELAGYFLDPDLYKKVGLVQVRRAQDGERIDTIINDEVETTNTAHAGDVVIKGPKGEEYIITQEKFEGRYTGPELSDDYQDYTPTGTTYAVEWTDGPILFTTAWEELMIMDDGDFLCSPTEVPSGDLYRIESGAFGLTYRPTA